MTFKDIAKELGITEQEARQAYRTGMDKIRRFLDENVQLKDWFYSHLQKDPPVISGKRTHQYIIRDEEWYLDLKIVEDELNGYEII